MEDNTLNIQKAIDLKIDTGICNEQCVPILEDVSGYIKLNKEKDDFTLAVIDLKSYNTFDNFLEQAIGRRRRAEYRKTKKEGYVVRILSAEERNNRRDELYTINTSATERQGKMNEEYFEYPKEVVEHTCNHHYQKTYGVFRPDNDWIGYIYPRFCGEVAATYRILGHAGHFGKINFMLFLMFEMIWDIYENDPQIHYLMYHLMYVGSQGLQDWKRHAGFKPVRFMKGTIG